MKPSMWGGPGAIEWSDPSLKWYVFYNEFTDALVVGCLVRDMWYLESEHGYNYYFPEEFDYTGHIKIGPL